MLEQEKKEKKFIIEFDNGNQITVTAPTIYEGMIKAGIEMEFKNIKNWREI